MKKMAILLMALVLIFLVSLLIHPSSSTNLPFPTSTPTPTLIDTSHQIYFKNQNYRYYYYQIPSTAKIELIPNFSPSHSAAEIIKERCDFAINGGLYTKEAKPVGLFYLNGQYLAPLITHSTFNGLLLQNKNGKLNLLSQNDFDQNFDQLNFVFQSGPYFDFSAPAKTHINQEYDRRHLVLKDDQNHFYFFSISFSDQAFSGPKLDDIPEFFSLSDIKKIANFTNALNLDGGSASAFYNGHYLLQELTPIGSLLCGTLEK